MKHTRAEMEAGIPSLYWHQAQAILKSTCVNFRLRSWDIDDSGTLGHSSGFAPFT